MRATTELRTPLDFTRVAYVHYPPDLVTNSWWFDYCVDSEMAQKSKESGWTGRLVTGLYRRKASEAFMDECSIPTSKCDDFKKHHRTSLAALWFGKSSFTAEQAFFEGMVTSPADLNGNPFLVFSKITPQFDYDEKGAWIGLSGEKRWKCLKKASLVIGGRSSLPFKEIEIVHHEGEGNGGIESGLNQVFEEAILEVNAGAAANSVDYAYRLDFLSTLIRQSLTTPLPLVEYGSGALPNVTKVAGIIIGDATNTINTDNPPAYVIKSTAGTVPQPAQLPNSTTFSFAKHQSQVAGSLPANGAGANGATYYFDASSDYAASLGTDRAVQATLFLVPRMKYTPNDLATGSPSNLSPTADSIRNAITELLNQFSSQNQSTAVEFLSNSCCIDLTKYERVLGIGDLNTELYIGIVGDDNRWYGNMVFGVLFPTGKQNKHPNRVYYQPTGNNGHFELKFGIEGGMKPCRYFGVKGDIFYSHVFSRKEKRAAPFKGALVRNIGSPVSMDVAWNWFVGHLDFTFFNPYNKDLLFSIGYEGYHKGRDSINICQKTAVDCLGRTEPLDACVLERGSSVIAHKIRGEISHRISYWELNLGASHVVAGRNAMQETEAHIDASIYF